MLIKLRWEEKIISLKCISCKMCPLEKLCTHSQNICDGNVMKWWGGLNFSAFVSECNVKFGEHINFCERTQIFCEQAQSFSMELNTFVKQLKTLCTFAKTFTRCVFQYRLEKWLLTVKQMVTWSNDDGKRINWRKKNCCRLKWLTTARTSFLSRFSQMGQAVK